MEAKHRKYQRLLDFCKSLPPTPTAVAHPCDESSLRGAVEAGQLGLITPILVGPRARIEAVAKQHGIDLANIPIVDAPYSEASAAKAVELVREGKAEALMKGSLHTDELMAAVVRRETGLRTARRVSHCFVMDVPSYAETLIVTDAAINIAPTLEDKVHIVQNAIDLAHAMRFPEVRVAILSAMETVNPEGPVDDRSRRVVQDGRSRADHGRDSRRSACARQRNQPRIGEDQEDRLAGGWPRERARGPGSRGGQHAREELVVPRRCRRRRDRARRARTDHPDEPRRLGDRSARVLRHCGAGRERASRSGQQGRRLRRSAMADAIVVLNAGSSSFKFSLFADSAQGLALVSRGQAEALYTSPRFLAKDGAGATLDEKSWGDGVSLGHAGALDHLVGFLRQRLTEHRLVGVGHRVVHGGPEYAQPVRVDASVLAALEKYVPLAPLHQPHNLAPIRALLERLPQLPQIACFDTAFHRGQPPVAQAFALPKAITDRGVIRYGFHGLSYEYVAGVLPEYDGRAAAGKVVVLHLGNGSSMCAIAGGRSVASTMGFTAADGLPMGTRCGSLDPGVVLYLMDELGMDARAIEKLIYQQSGLLGVSGISSDMRTLEASSEPGRQGGHRPLRLPDRPRAGLARCRARRARRDRVHRRGSARTAARCASASAARPAGSAWSWMPMPTRAALDESAPPRVACRRGSFQPTRN